MVKQGFTAVFPPFLMRRAAYEGVVDLTDFENVMYKIDGEDLYLIATSEHPMGAMFMDEVIDVGRLPVTLTGAATEHPGRQGRWREVCPPHAERDRDGDLPRPGGRPGELSERGRERDGSESVASAPGRARRDPRASAPMRRVPPSTTVHGLVRT